MLYAKRALESARAFQFLLSHDVLMYLPVVCQDSLSESPHPEEALQAFFKLSRDLLCIRRSNGYFQQLNSAWTETLGWTIEELRSRPWWEFVHPEDLEFTRDMEERCYAIPANNPSIEYKNRFRCKDGSYRWLLWRLSPYQNGRNYGLAKDVTDSSWRNPKQYPPEVQAALKLREQAIAASSVGITIADARIPGIPLVYVNPAFENLTGYEAREVLGRNCRFLQGPETSQLALARIRTALERGEHCTVTLLNYRQNGTTFWNKLTISPIYDSRDRLTHFVGILIDVSDRVRTEQALRLEKRKSEALLRNIFPQPVVQQLKQTQGSLAQQFPEATILFADIVGFTPLSAQLSPIELVNLLNQIFSRFDRLAEKHGVEKIKTIGDAYMAVAGVPVSQEEHAEAIANLALEMQAAIAQFQRDFGQPFQMRIGINTGSVVAGTIGLKRFIYDLWGDAVNVASRMESSGKPGKIQVTAETYERLKDRYLFEKRGSIEVKGKGEMTAYWLVGRRDRQA